MFLIIGLMLISNMFVINHYQTKIDQHSKVLTIIYRSQSSIESLSNTANKIFRQNEFDIKDELLLTSAKISQNIGILIKGGKVIGTDLIISPTSEDIRGEAKDLQKNWRQAIALLNIIQSDRIRIDSVVKEQIVKTEFIDSTYQEVSHEVDRIILIPNPDIKNSLSQFSSYKKLLFSDLSNLISSVIADYEKQRQLYDFVLLIVLLVNLIVVGLFLFLMTKAFITPLEKISQLTTKVANGEDVDIRYNKPDEISQIVSSVKSLGNHLRQASDFIHHIGEGNLEATLEGLNEEKDKEGSLANALINMQSKLKVVSREDKTRNWATRGMAKFAEILRTHNSNLHTLGDAILAELVGYTDANIGCIYVPSQSDDNQTLELVAFYAYDTKKHFNETVTIGEGLIGQTFVEKKTTYLLEIPEDYTHIKSGVGTSSPKSILVVPLKVNEEIFGVLEIASFKEFSQEQIDFIEKVGETIAGTIHNVINAEQTKKLLEDSQQLTEQMRAQEEEMRQNMEELSATQEEIARKELQTSSTIEVFDRAVATVEFDQEGVIINTNTLFAKLSEQSKNSLIGNNIATIIKTRDQKTIQPIIDRTFQNKKSSTDNLQLTTHSQQEVLSITANISYLKSDHAFMICHQSATPKPVDRQMTEIKEELTQNLNMLEVAQKSLDEKLNAFEHTLIYIEINNSGEIISSNSKAGTILMSEKENLTDENYIDLLKVTAAMKKTIREDINLKQHYHGIVSIKNSDNINKKIMLHIEQVKDKK